MQKTRGKVFLSLLLTVTTILASLTLSVGAYTGQTTLLATETFEGTVASSWTTLLASSTILAPTVGSPTTSSAIGSPTAGTPTGNVFHIGATTQSGNRTGTIALPGTYTNNYMEVSFDWFGTGIENADGNYMQLRDSSGNIILELRASGDNRNTVTPAQILASRMMLNDVAIGTNNIARWYTVNAKLNFLSHNIMSFSITPYGSDASAATTVTNTPFVSTSASDLSKLYFDGQRYGEFELDNFSVVSSARSTAAFHVVDANTSANLSGATIQVTDSNNYTYSALTSDASGNASLVLPDGTYTYTVNATGYISSTSTQFTVSGSDIPLTISLLSQSEPSVPTSIAVSGGQAYLYKNASSAATATPFSAIVYDQFTPAKPITGEAVIWSMYKSTPGDLNGSGININSTNGTVSIDSTASTSILPDGGEITATIVATSAHTGYNNVQGIATIKLRGIQKVSTFTISGPSAVIINGTGTYSVSGIADAYGLAMTGYSPSWSIDTGASIDSSSGILTAGSNIANTTVSATIDGVTKTKAVCIANYTGTLPVGTLNTNYTFLNINGETVLVPLTNNTFGTGTNDEFAELDADVMITALPTSGSYKSIFNALYCSSYLLGDLLVDSNGCFCWTSGSTTHTTWNSSKALQPNKWYNVKLYLYPKIDTEAAGNFELVVTGDFGNGSETVYCAPVLTRNSASFTTLSSWTLASSTDNSLLLKNLSRTAAGTTTRPSIVVTSNANGQVLDGTMVITSGSSVKVVGNKIFTITPVSGYGVKTATYNGRDVTSSLVSNAGTITYTASNVFANGTLDVVFDVMYPATVTGAIVTENKITATINNVSLSAIDSAVGMAALYNSNGSLIGLVDVPITNLASGTSVTKDFNFTSVSGASSYKIFIWNTLDNIKPLSVVSQGII